MWGRKSKVAAGESEPPSPLKAAMHAARIEAAERTSVVVDLRDAEVARLELLIMGCLTSTRLGLRLWSRFRMDRNSPPDFRVWAGGLVDAE